MSPLFSFETHQTQTITYEGLHGCSLSIALAHYCDQISGIKLVVTQDSLSAQQLYDEIPFFIETAQPIDLFPDWETLPYDQFSPHQDLISTRLKTLHRLHTSPYTGIVIASISTLLHRLCPVNFLHQHMMSLKVGQRQSLVDFKTQLIEAGYRPVQQVLEHGEFAARGHILDLFPMGLQYPLRIEWDDETLESLRIFDPETQRTLQHITEVNMLPAHEFPLNPTGIEEFRQQFRTLFSGNPSQCPIYEQVSAQQAPSGIEYYLPLFFKETSTIFDFLPQHTHIIHVGDIRSEGEIFMQTVRRRYDERCHDRQRPLVLPETLFMTPTSYFEALQTYPLAIFSQKPSMNTPFAIEQAPLLTVERQTDDPFHRLKTHLQTPGYRFLLMVESAGRRDILLTLLQKSGLSIHTSSSFKDALDHDALIQILIAPVTQGVIFSDAKLSIIAESQLFHSQPVPQSRRRQKSNDTHLLFKDLTELSIGMPVVHLDFGVGRYQGLQTITHDETTNEFLVIHYADQAKIYVPVTALHCISRYSGQDPEHAPLHRLGTDQWEKEKKRAQAQTHDIAVELLALYAIRHQAQGFAYHIDPVAYATFAASFPFEETPDQTQAIQAVFDDMQSLQPMDRLICGDVGFGKTEVAMRAAFIAVQNQKQVCVLVPTTLLATQHFETFSDRFSDIPVHIELLSRFRQAKASKDIIEKLKDGRIDIIIGTHKLFQKHIDFKDLGLLIIDEEHRFGVKQKEQINTLKTHIDVLSMTATPIPRTLNMAMAGIRDISLITTPPAKRRSIKTFWQTNNQATIQEAIAREILRGGQVFFLHNHVQTIEKTTRDLQTQIPDARIRFAHGQMKERELEQIMSDFYHHRFNVLVCTTIIETGIDIPTANTIIIDRADQFGLAQLHQLRGRVGRSHHQAYAYLLTPPHDLLTSDAKKRLEAIVSLEDLGAGFTLASHDLEIRGAGDLLGEAQSGNMHSVGFHLFMDMLEQAIHDLKSGRIEDPLLKKGPHIALTLSTIIPEHYVPDVSMRFMLYQRIHQADTEEALHALQIECIDRFGLMPDSVQYLFEITHIKQLCQTIGITHLQGTPSAPLITFSESPKLNPLFIIKLIQRDPEHYQMKGPHRLSVVFTQPNITQQLDALKDLLIQLCHSFPNEDHHEP